MADYTYTREIVDGAYNINNLKHLEGGSTPVPLSNEIKAEATLPDVFQINCNAAVCTITFSPALTSAQKDTLDGLVVYQKIDN